jgi:hypothetical protein
MQLNEVSTELLRERLLALANVQLGDAEIIKLLSDLVSCGGSVTLELNEVRVKLIRREGRFSIKKDDLRPRVSSIPPRTER